MTGAARKQTVDPTQVQVFHCWNRCARQIHAFGVDQQTGKDNSHRAFWIEDHERAFARLFFIDIGFHAEMSNHFHLILRTRPDAARECGAREIVRRALCVNHMVRHGTCEIPEIAPQTIQAKAKNAAYVNRQRRRLSDLSHYMAAVDESIARRVNTDEKAKGKFWEDRFGSRLLEGDEAILLAALYVDLNVIRAGLASSPETSVHTSAFDRIHSWLVAAAQEESLSPAEFRQFAQELGWSPETIESAVAQTARLPEPPSGSTKEPEMGPAPKFVDMWSAPSAPAECGRAEAGHVETSSAGALPSEGPAAAGEPHASRSAVAARDSWLSPLMLNDGPDRDVAAELKSTTRWRATDKGVLPMTLENYLRLLDWAGRQVRSDKRGSIPADLAPILERLRIRPTALMDTLLRYEQLFRRMIGPVSALRAAAQRLKRRSLHGVKSCAAIFVAA